MISYIIVALLFFIAGVILAGYVVAVIGGIRTDLALAKVKAGQDVTELHSRIGSLINDFNAELATLKAKLP